MALSSPGMVADLSCTDQKDEGPCGPAYPRAGHIHYGYEYVYEDDHEIYLFPCYRDDFHVYR